MSDQATRLRTLVGRSDAQAESTFAARSRPQGGAGPSGVRGRPRREGRLAQAIAVTSGKGGVGKTNLAVNLAVCLARLGRRVCLLDADLGLANADVLCGLTPRLTLEHVVLGRCRLAQAMLLAPGGFRLIPGACGVSRLADMRAVERVTLLEQLSGLERVADSLVIDTAAGLSANVLAFAAAARQVVVVTTPEPTAMTDAYGMIKALLARAQSLRVDLVVNMVRSEAEGERVFRRMDRVTRTFLGRGLTFAGCVPMDPVVREAVHHRVPFSLYAPESRATKALQRLTRRLIGLESPAGDQPNEGFFTRLAAWLSPRQAFSGSS